MKTAVLISGELRFLEDCLPTLKYINDQVDVYVSTWDKVIIKNTYLGIDIEEDVTEERIRALLPNARILIEPLDCYSSKRYSDRMVHRWIAGWNMIRSTGIKYDRVTITRPDLFFDQNSVFQYNEKADMEVLWYNKPKYLQDSLFSMKWEYACRFLDELKIEDWTESEDHNVHTWFYSMATKHNPNYITSIFQNAGCVFYRATNNSCYKTPTFQNAVFRQLDWRDSQAIQRAKNSPLSFDVLKDSWSDDVIEEIVLSYKSGRTFRKCDSDSLLILAGKIRNFHAMCMSLPVFGNVDVGIVGWNGKDAYRIRHILRTDTYEFYDEKWHATEIRARKQSKFHDNVEYMLVHLEKALALAERTNHTKIIITRPDVLLLTDEFSVDPKDGLAIFYDSIRESANDLLWVFNRPLLQQMKLLPEKIRQLSIKMDSNNVHTIIPIALRELGININNADIITNIKNVCIQRDTFQFLLNDEYSKEFFIAVQCDSAAWWRRTHKSNYFFSLHGII